MKAVILAGGKGLRLRRVIKGIPKPMAVVSGKPFLEYLILQLKAWGIKHIVLSIGYKGKVIRQYFQDGKKWGVRIVYSQEAIPLGTAGALSKALQLSCERVWYVLNGDSYFDCNFANLKRFHAKRKALVTMGLVSVRERGRFGAVTVNKDNSIKGFREKDMQGVGLVNSGVYCVDRRLLKEIPRGRVSLENDIFPRLIGHGLYGFPSKGFFVDIGIPLDYRRLSKVHFPMHISPRSKYHKNKRSLAR
jgi:D-glycero-alpha-D-manno-heptose 1-phosphate guanylyltransferase